MPEAGSRASTTREAVLGAAVRLVDREGLDALTMRKLAEEAGIGAMTLYSYVKTKDEILDGLAGAALQQPKVDAASELPWHEQLTQTIRDLHHVLHLHPGVVQLLISQSVAGPALDQVRERMLGILRGAGFDNTHAVDALGAVVSYALGFVVMERARTAGQSPDELRDRLAALPAAEFPNLTATHTEYSSHVSTRSFEYGLRHLIQGLRGDLELATSHLNESS